MKIRFSRISIAVLAVMICTAYLGCGGGGGTSGGDNGGGTTTTSVTTTSTTAGNNTTSSTTSTSSSSTSTISTTTTTTSSGTSASTSTSTTTTTTTVATTTTTTVPLTTAAGKLPDTGQTYDYTTTFGEDSDYSINPPSFTVHGDGTVTDNVTGLVWQRTGDGTTRTWADAGTYCDNLTLGGYTDWRLPTVKELADIVNFGAYKPSVFTVAFTGATKSSYYWSSTTFAGGSNAFGVHFYYSFVDADDQAVNHYVRCVRGGQSFAGFTDNGNGMVTDGATGLTWQKQDDGTERVWLDAISYCEALSLGGKTDWRLPNVKELKSIVDYTKYNPAIDTAFTGTQSSNYWSSTSVAGNADFEWCVDFYDGYVSLYGGYMTQYHRYVRCVRGGQ